MQDIFITLNSYDPEELMEKGQQSFVKRVQAACATGIEIRKELLRNEHDLEQIALELQRTPLKVVYSAPVPIWNQDEQLNLKELTAVLKEASIIEAGIVKFPLGHFNKQIVKLEELESFLREVSDGVIIMVENDQTSYGGNIHSMKSFAKKCEKLRINVPFVFDTGNWHYVDQCFQAAMEECGDYVGYLHLKQVVKYEGTCTTIPLKDEEEAEWKQALHRIKQVPIGIEFPLESDEKAQYYVQLIRENCQEEVVL